MLREHNLLVLLLSILLLTGCTSTPPAAPQVEPSGKVSGITLPPDCGPVQLKITMTQDPGPGGTGAHVEGGGIVQKGELQMPDLSGFDFSRQVKIDIEVVVGNCPPFTPPASWHFEGILQSLGNGKYSAEFSEFKPKKTH